MNFSSINIQGNIISSDILTKIAQDDIRFQKPSDFGLNHNTLVRDEIGIAWSLAQAHWKAFSAKREQLREEDTGTTLTRQSWIVPLMQALGFDLQVAKAEIINEKTYAISHRAVNKDGFPIHIVGVNQSLDKRAEFGARLSPHALVQEYLNNHDHLYAFATNGSFLRVLRDATRLSRLSYLEFNLERMMEEELYAEFAVMFRVIHATRMPVAKEDGAECVFEFYHQEALASGTRIRERLSDAVEKSIRALGNGLVKHQGNDRLREKLDGSLKASDYYLFLLRTVYRILFLLVIEERHLIYPEKRDEEMQKKRRFYYDFYSLQRLTRLVERRVYVDPRKLDLWDSLLTTFKLFESEAYGAKLGLQALASGLFDSNGIGALGSSKLDNHTLLQVLRYLVMFENENKQWTRVNYADLDVEEFGSVYEGLLEYEPVVDLEQASFGFIEGTGRSSSGSHYTPEELVKPLIKHSLDYIIADKLKEGKAATADQWLQMQAQCDALLTITVCDVACGSGHILLSAARRIGTELAVLRESIAARSVVEQPSPTYLRAAIRDVIRHCIYGVDLNPLAVELCKVALWLEAHNPGEPLNFLDHHIKCGNAIVGLAHFEELENGIATEAFKTLPEDDKDIAATFRKQNDAERKMKGQLSTYNLAQVDGNLKGLRKEFAEFNTLPENTPAQITAKAEAYQKLTSGSKWFRLKNLADLQVAQFFIPKTFENKDKLTTEAQYRTYLNSGSQILDRGASMVISAQKRFFHWFLEFPQVFSNGGFDCILGNPPFLGGKRISGHYGDGFLNFIKTIFAPAIGGLDLVAYFFRRDFKLLKMNGFQSLISTNTISQGDTRLGGLNEIIANGGTINHAVRSMKWPGLAAVDVSLVTIVKGEWLGKSVLDSAEVSQITSFLDNSISLGDPLKLKQNENKGFIGSVVNGKGFVLDKDEAAELIRKDSSNRDVLFPYLNGDDLNTRIDQSPSRWVINFFDWPLNDLWDRSQKEPQGGPYASDYPLCFAIVEEKVKQERSFVKRDKYRNIWWQFAERGVKLYETIRGFSRVLVCAEVTKYASFSFQPANIVFMHTLKVFAFQNARYLSILTSFAHEHWAWKYSSRMGDSTLRYTPSSCFETFSFPNVNSEIAHGLDHLGELMLDHREHLMMKMSLGLTKTYNAFHAIEIQPSLKTSDLESKTNKEIEKQYGKETWNLWSHLQKTEGTCSWEEAVQGIVELRQLHKQMDEAVLEAYGWHTNSEKWGKAIRLLHDFYEVDYLPENDRVRYSIHPDARKEVLKRLLLLNHERFEEEVFQGLHKKDDVEAFYVQKGKAVPEDVVFSDVKAKKETIKKITKPIQIAQPSLFDSTDTSIMKEFGLHDGIYSIRDTAEIISQPYDKVRRWFLSLSDANYEGLSASAKTDIENRRICFHGLVELVVIGELLEAGVKPKSIFVARKELASITKQPYPFATSDIKDKLKVSGSDIVFDFDEGLLTLDGSRQFNLNFIREFFADIVFKSRVAIQLLPAKGHKRIQIDPKSAGGRPAFISKKNITVETIIRFYNGPDSMDEIIEDYGITREDVEAALAYQS